MILVGLTGGIGSGKSTVSSVLAGLGAVIVDADAITREVQAPGSPLLEKLADRFGGGVVTADGALDRAALAALAFADAESVKDLNDIVHPVVGTEMNKRINAERHTSNVVVMDVPLLTENPREGLQATIVVDLAEELQVQRLVELRGFDEADVRARIARQATREQRLERATHVIDNSGSVAALNAQVHRIWLDLVALPQLPGDFEWPVRPPKVDGS